ncbi:MAG: MATE family efflux transporter [Bacillota bacterium]
MQREPAAQAGLPGETMLEAQIASRSQPSPDNRAIRTQVLSLAFPAMAEMLLQTITQIISMILVGHLGANAVTSIGISTQPLNMLMGVFQGIAVAVTALVARSIGAGRREDASRAAAQGVTLAGIIALAASALMLTKARAVVTWMGASTDVVDQATQYLLIMTPGLFFLWMSSVITGALRGAGDNRTPMKVNMTISLLSFAGNIVLVYGLFGFPALGVLGAGLATSIARVTGGLLLLIPYLLGRLTLPCRFPRDFRWDGSLMARVVRVGIPGAGERLLISGGGLFYARMVAGLGAVSYAAHTIGINAESVSYMPGTAFAVAATTLVGQNLGAERPDVAERSTYQALSLACMFVGVVGVGFLAFPGALIRLYSSDPEVIRLASIYLRMMGFCQVHQAFGFVILGAIRGAGDTKFVTWVTAFCAWVLRLGTTYLLIEVVGKGVTGAWWGMAADGFVKGVAGWLWFRRGRWKKASV